MTKPLPSPRPNVTPTLEGTPTAAAQTAPPAATPSRAFIRGFLIGIISLLVLLFYIVTGAPGAWWGDGQELATAAWTLGIPHPTGYPLYMLTGHLAMRLLGWLDPGRALTLYSAVLVAASVGLLIGIFRRVISDDSAEPAGPASCPRVGSCACGMANLPLAIGLGLFVAFSRTLWEHATFAEVYPLTFFLGAVVLALAWTPADARPGLGRSVALGLALGLAALNHYSFLAFTPLAGLAVLRWGLKAGRPWRFSLTAFFCFVAMLPAYLYLPLRARANPPLNWGDPSTLERLLWVLGGGQFRSMNINGGEQAVGQGLLRWLGWWGGQWLPQPGHPGQPGAALQAGLALLVGLALVTLAVAGLIILIRRRWELGLGLLGALCATAGFAALYHIPDIDAYFLPALPAAVVGWIVAARWLIGRLRTEKPASRVLPLLTGPLGRGLPALLALAALAGQYGAVAKAWDDGPEVYGERALAALPQGALVLTDGDADIFTLWYQQIVRGVRPDVTVAGSRFIFSGWYARYFERPGRPSIPVGIEPRPLGYAQYQYEFDAALFTGTLLPNFAQGRRVFVTYINPVLWEYFAPQPVTGLLPQDYAASCAYPFLPSPILYELKPNPALARMSRDELTQELLAFYCRHTPPARPSLGAPIS